MKQINDFTVIDNKQPTSNFSVLTLQLETQLPFIKPGQFVEVRIDNTPEVMLRRPISIHDVDYEKREIKLLIQNVGKGSNTLCNSTVGTKLNLIYPLGNGFQLPKNSKRALLVGGGCGVAPLLYLGRYYRDNRIEPFFLLGAKNKDALLQLHEFQQIGETFVTTEDGSFGHKGVVTDHQVINSNSINFDVICTCGPEVMMKAISKQAEKHGIPCYVSLENRMACGIGACLCCVVNTIEGNKCTCVEGPVFNSQYLKW